MVSYSKERSTEVVDKVTSISRVDKLTKFFKNIFKNFLTNHKKIFSFKNCPSLYYQIKGWIIDYFSPMLNILFKLPSLLSRFQYQSDWFYYAVKFLSIMINLFQIEKKFIIMRAILIYVKTKIHLKIKFRNFSNTFSILILLQPKKALMFKCERKSFHLKCFIENTSRQLTEPLLYPRRNL